MKYLRRFNEKKNDIKYMTWEEFKEDKDLFDGELTKAYFKYDSKEDEEEYGVSDINQFEVDGSYFCTTDNCIEHYRENPGYYDEEEFDLKDNTIIAVSKNPEIMYNEKMKKEILSNADAFYCSVADTLGLVVWNRKKIKK